jgi:hypothetical protein
LPEKGKALAAGNGWAGDAPPQAGPPAKPAPKNAGPAYSLEDLFLFDPTFESCW